MVLRPRRVHGPNGGSPPRYDGLLRIDDGGPDWLDGQLGDGPRVGGWLLGDLTKMRTTVFRFNTTIGGVRGRSGGRGGRCLIIFSPLISQI